MPPKPFNKEVLSFHIPLSCPTRYYFGYTCIRLERFLSFFIPLDRHGGGPRREMDGTKKNIKTNGSCNGMVRTEYGKANIWKYGIDRQSSFFLHRSIFWTTTHFGSVWLVVKRTETLRNLGKGTKSEISLWGDRKMETGNSFLSRLNGWIHRGCDASTRWFVTAFIRVNEREPFLSFFGFFQRSEFSTLKFQR